MIIELDWTNGLTKRSLLFCISVDLPYNHLRHSFDTNYFFDFTGLARLTRLDHYSILYDPLLWSELNSNLLKDQVFFFLLNQSTLFCSCYSWVNCVNCVLSLNSWQLIGFFISTYILLLKNLSPTTWLSQIIATFLLLYKRLKTYAFIQRKSLRWLWSMLFRLIFQRYVVSVGAIIIYNF
jgi:hypothetical protein